MKNLIIQMYYILVALIFIYSIILLFSKFANYIENKHVENSEYSANNPSVTIMDVNTLEISFNNLARPEARANYMRAHKYEVISASKDNYGNTIYIVKIKREIE